MTLAQHTDIALPAHRQAGGFDHAAVHHASARLYVAHTANDARDVIDCATDRYLYFIPHLVGVAGALVSDDHSLVFTSNRGENTVGIFAPDEHTAMASATTVSRSAGLAAGPSVGTALWTAIGPSAPFLVGGAVKIAYDLMLWGMFRRVTPPEEVSHG